MKNLSLILLALLATTSAVYADDTEGKYEFFSFERKDVYENEWFLADWKIAKGVAKNIRTDFRYYEGSKLTQAQYDMYILLKSKNVHTYVRPNGKQLKIADTLRSLHERL